MDKQCENFLENAGVIDTDLRVSIPSSYDDFVFDTDEARKLHTEHPEWHIWTMVDGDEGGMYILDGWHFVNRSGYIFTTKPPSDAIFNPSRNSDGTVSITYVDGEEVAAELAEEEALENQQG